MSLTVKADNDMINRGNDFLEESREVARYFSDLYLNEGIDVSTRSPELVSDKSADTGPDVNREVARRLREFGDNVNGSIKQELERAFKELIQHQSIWDIDETQFADTCRSVLRSCRGYVQSGWEQVYIVYGGIARLVGELPSQGTGGGMRRSQMQGFAGNFMRESGIEEWIQEQGGMQRVCQPVRGDKKCAEIVESEV